MPDTEDPKTVHIVFVGEGNEALQGEEPANGPNEAWYDAEIAPELLRLAKLCEDRGMGFLAMLDFGVAEQETRSASTMCLPVGATNDDMRLTYYAMRAKGNIDTLAFTLAKDCRQNRRNHSSIVLTNLGVPTTWSETEA